MAPQRRLSALDATFLAAETPRTPMHVGSVSTFEAAPFLDTEGGFRIDELRELVEERLHLVPRFRQRVMQVPLGIARPVWVDDPDFDIANHVKLIELPPPGGDAELRRICERLHMELLDRSRPLWELWCVHGVGDNRVAIIEKVHHAMVDGIASVDVATMLMDATPEVRRLDTSPWQPSRPPRPLMLMAAGLGDDARTRGRLAAAALNTVRHPGRTLAALQRLRRPVSTLTTGQLFAPRTSLNESIGTTRRYEIVRQSLAETKEIRARLGGTVNDIVLAGVAGGLRRLLLERGEAVNGRSLHALVPVSLRTAGQHDLGNRVAAILALLPVGEADPEARLRAVQDTMRDRKDRQQAMATAALLATTEYLPAWVAASTARVIHHQPFVNLVVTNVPGPQMPLYIMGSRMIETFPIVPLGGNLDISVGILSYDGQLNFGLYADGEKAADVAILAEGIEKSFIELHHVGAAGREG